MSKLPSMPFYPADFFADTRHLSWECQGLYLLMLMHAWLSGGSLPSDEKTLIRILRIHGNRWNALKKDVLPFWHTENSRLFQGRLSRNWEEIHAKITTNIENGKLGGRPPKSLLSNGWAKPNGFNLETQTKGNYNYNQNYKEDSYLIEKGKKKANGQVFVKEDTPQWKAWAEHYRKSSDTGTGPPKAHSDEDRTAVGWWFPTEWPPKSQPPPRSN